MQKRIALLIIVLLLVFISITVFFAVKEAAKIDQEAHLNYLATAASYISANWQGEDKLPVVCGEMSKIFSNYNVAIRVTVIRSDGKVLWDESLDYEQMDNHFLRPEVYEALKTKGQSSIVRYSKSLKEEMHYYALYLKDYDVVVRTSFPLLKTRLGISAMMRNMAVMIILIFILVMGLSFFLTRKITKPLSELQEVSRRMAAGDYSSRHSEYGHIYPETKSLSQDFNQMAEVLEENHRSLSRKTARLDAIINSMNQALLVVDDACYLNFMNENAKVLFARSIDEKRHSYPVCLLLPDEGIEDLIKKALSSQESQTAEVDLHTAKGLCTFSLLVSPIRSEEAERGAVILLHDMTEEANAQQLRSEFVANVTHELRTPLTSIRGFIETLTSGAAKDVATQKRFLEFVDVEAERLDKLISDILSLSAIEARSKDRSLKYFDFNELLDEIAVQLDDYASEHQVSIIVRPLAEDWLIRANRDRIKQILINLTDNAIKYNRPEGKVYLSGEIKGKKNFRIKVKDTGMGIPLEQQDRVFERFYRLEQSRTRDLGGTGLGLSIVKHIAQLYKGEAKLTSLLGRGSVFTVDLELKIKKVDE